MAQKYCDILKTLSLNLLCIWLKRMVDFMAEGCTIVRQRSTIFRNVEIRVGIQSNPEIEKIARVVISVSAA